MPIVQSALNNAPIKRLGMKCPLDVFTGIQQDSHFFGLVRRNGELEILSLTQVRFRQINEFIMCKEGMEQVHRNFFISTSRKQKSAIDFHNRKTKVRPINFSEGDFVLKGLVQKKKKHTSFLYNGLDRSVSQNAKASTYSNSNI
eukprot:gb/GEZJ01005338.1/.p1 GENE.gb/GEZJ01005338.1/~~gb/GEZJ01005338.1/.p1  ORF type:complete len:144 (-),score=18.55 gb/GEZJ01005338.1/:544-975(-)